MLKGYEKRDDGVVKQVKLFKKIQEYNTDYVETRYNTYGELGLRMAHLRVGYMKAAFETAFPHMKLESILDVGYGNGDFLKTAAEIIPNCYGNDISGYPVPDNCTKVNDLSGYYDVICFFDVLEHFENIDFIKDLNCKMILISVPECHFSDDETWFKSWKHRRPDEHLYHFNAVSLETFFMNNGFAKHSISSIEDLIRKPADENSNILTGTFIKKY